MTDLSAASFGTALRALIDHLDSAIERTYRAAGLDFRPRFTPIVRTLSAQGPQTIRSLSAVVGVSHSAISQTVTQMATRRLVSVSSGVDARQRIVALGPVGLSILPLLEKQWSATTNATLALDAEAGGSLIESVTRANIALGREAFGERLRRAAKDGLEEATMKTSSADQINHGSVTPK